MACMRDGFKPGTHLDNGRFVTTSPLNHGSFGMVLAARDTATGEDVAVKCITKPSASATWSCPAAIATDDRSEELVLHSRLSQHPNIVNLLDHFETDNHQYMVLELCPNGDLYEAIRLGKGPLETEHVRDLMRQLVNAVDHLHSNGVYHRDIKPENIFLTSSGSMKLGDFGLATTETWSTEFAVGSDRYMAPEQYDASVYGYGYSPAAADIWAIGIVLLNVIFQRNPFATPTPHDPLFADFARDRQSLFDVFPNMSQDTYNVLVHSLALDPANRSLAAVREALEAAISFTIDDESLDDFCTDQTPDIAPVATAAREPLRTPSVTSPTLSSDGSFPWTALLQTPQKLARQLSTIRDEDADLFPGAGDAWQYVDPDDVSLSSAVDSGLGMSYKSAKSAVSTAPAALKKPKSTTFVGSLPISFSRPSTKSSPYGATGFSKSWSDLYDEEEEEEDEEDSDEMHLDSSPVNGTNEASRVNTATPQAPQLSSLQEEDCGSVTPRPGLATLDANVMDNPYRVSVVPPEPAARIPKTKSSSILDKWAALGNFRRAKLDPAVLMSTPTAAVTPPKIKYSEAFASFTPFGSSSNKKGTPIPRSRERTPSWRPSTGSPQRLRSTSFNNSRVWQDDNNWREHKPPYTKTPTPPMPPIPPGGWGDRYRPGKSSFDDSDDGDVEWVGGYRFQV